MDVGGTALAAMALFAATNIDDAFLLTAWFARGHPPARQVVVGQYAGIAILFVVSAAFGAAVSAFATDWVRLLGLVPLFLGVRSLWSAIRDRDSRRDDAATPSGPIAVAVVTIASGSDNISVYTPVFAHVDMSGLAVVAAVFIC